MPRGKRILDETIYPADATRWDVAFDRAPLPITTAGIGSALLASYPDNEPLRDMMPLALRLHSDLGAGATLDYNASGPLPIYTAQNVPISAGIKAGAVIGVTYSQTAGRWYVTGAGGGGGARPSVTTSGSAAALTAALSGFERVDMAAITIKLHTSVDGTPTLNVEGTGAAPIIDASGQPYVTAAAGTILDLVYNGTAYVMQGVSYGNLNNLLGNMPVDGGAFVQDEPKGITFDGGLF